MTSTPRFTIVTIGRNDLQGLKRTVASVAQQTLGEWEHVIVDGASTDGTVTWLQGLPADSRRRWSSSPDGGIYDAMNTGLADSRGELLMVVNSGDCLAEGGTLERLHDSQRDVGWDWSYGAVRFTDTSGRPTGAYTFDPYVRTKFLMGINWIPQATVCMTSELFTRVGKFRENLGTSADQEWLMRAANLCDPFVITWFIADFERGGVSQTVGPRERELIWHRMRAASGNLWKGSKTRDRLIAELLSTRTPARIIAKRLGGGRA